MYRKDISVTLSLPPFFLRNHLETAVGPNLNRSFILAVPHGALLGNLRNYHDDLITQIRSLAFTNTYIYFHIVLRQEEQGMNKTWRVPWLTAVPNV